MGSRYASAVQVVTVAAATVAIGVLLIVAGPGEQSLSLVAIGSTFLGSVVAFVTAASRLREDRAELDMAEVRLREELERQLDARRAEEELNEERFVARSVGHDALAVLDDVLRNRSSRPEDEPSDVVFQALALASQASQRLASLGSIDEATRLDEQVRLLLDSHGLSSWLASAWRWRNGAPWGGTPGGGS